MSCLSYLSNINHLVFWGTFVDSFCKPAGETVKVKVKYTLYRDWGSVQAVRPVGGVEVYVALPFHDHDTGSGWGVSVRPGRSLLSGKTRYPLYRRMGEPQSRSGQVRKISPPPGFVPRTVQPLVIRYTDWATRRRTCDVSKLRNEARL
jgi:hypothetical protein